MRIKIFSTVTIIALAATVLSLRAVAEETEVAVPTSEAIEGASVQPPDAAERERQAIEQTLRKTLQRSEAERMESDKRYREAVEREIQSQDQLKRLSAEKAALEKSCPPKQGDENGKTAASGKKKKVGKARLTSRSKISRHSVVDSGNKSAAKATKTKKIAKNKRGSARKVASVVQKQCSGPKVSMAAVIKALAGDRNLSGKNLSRMNLLGMELTGAKLKGACLTEANLERADLAEADLERADLSGANMRKASLRLANINGAAFDGANLDGAIWTDSRICLAGSIGSCRDLIP